VARPAQSTPTDNGTAELVPGHNSLDVTDGYDLLRTEPIHDNAIPVQVVAQRQPARRLVEQNQKHRHAKEHDESHQEGKKTDLLGTNALVDQFIQEPNIECHNGPDE
jgi:hypothetical protein